MVFRGVLATIDFARFATLNLVVPDGTDKSKITQKMEIEKPGWFARPKAFTRCSCARL
jgi:hypothetical protein